MSRAEELTEEQWAVIEHLFPELQPREDARGRPPADTRAVLSGVLWVMRTGAPWADLPERYPPYQTCHRRFQLVGANGHATSGLGSTGRGSAKSGQTRPVGVLHRRDLCSREKRGAGVGKTKRGKRTKIMAVADRNGLPIAVHTESASPHEVTLLQAILEQSLLGKRPTRLIGDKAYDSDKLDAKLEEQGIELIAPHRSNRTVPQTQDGRALRRTVRRWKIERLFAWLGNFRRLLHRWEYHLENYTGFVQLGCMIILLRNYFLRWLLLKRNYLILVRGGVPPCSSLKIQARHSNSSRITPSYHTHVPTFITTPCRLSPKRRLG